MRHVVHPARPASARGARPQMAPAFETSQDLVDLAARHPRPRRPPCEAIGWPPVPKPPTQALDHRAVVARMARHHRDRPAGLPKRHRLLDAIPLPTNRGLGPAQLLGQLIEAMSRAPDAFLVGSTPSH